MKHKKYSRLDGKDERLEILKVRWKGWKIRDTQGQMEMMNEQEYSHLEGSDENRKYSRFIGIDVRLEILKGRWQGCKIGNAQGQVEEIGGYKYSRLVGMVERFKIFKVRWKG